MRRRRRTQSALSLFSFQDIITSICGIVVLITLILALELTSKIVEASIADPVRSRAVYNQMLQEVEEMTGQIDDLGANLDRMADDVARSIALSLPEIQAQIEQVRAEIRANEQKLENWNDLLTESDERNRRALLLDEENKRLEEQKQELQKLYQELLEKSMLAADDDDFLYFDKENAPKEAPWLVDIDQQAVRVIPAASILPSGPKPFTGDDDDICSSFMKWAKKRSETTEYFVLLVRPEGADLYEEIKARLQAADFRVGVDYIGQYQKIQLTESHSDEKK
ncbi:MAG: hypothetical protein IKF77_08390 [Thermoguttaceae bacterium]|nr:hypothetical protein [Thermoguttaceae bacterium]